MTKQGTVKIAGKSTAVVWASGTETLIYNLNDNHLGDVSVIVGKQKIVVPLGSQLVLAKNTNFKELNAKARIAFRNGSSFEFAQTA